MRAFDAPRTTIRQALALLEREGRIHSVGKSGWYVAPDAPPEPEPDLAGRRVLLLTFRRPTTATVDAVAAGLGEALGERGVGLLRFDSAGDEATEAIDSVESLTTIVADGLVMWPDSPVDAALLTRLQASTPLVLVDRRVFGFGADCVIFDDLEGGRLVTEHLIERGHRRIAFLGDEPFVESVQRRWRGYRRALERAGIEPDDNLTVLTYGRHEPNFSAHVRFLLRELPEPPTAVVCSNDSVASDLLLLLRHAGVRVPDDVAVTGFGNHNARYLDVMGLTSVSQPFEAMGREAGRIMLGRLTEPPSRRQPAVEVCLPMTLASRSTSGNAPAKP